MRLILLVFLAGFCLHSIGFAQKTSSIELATKRNCGLEAYISALKQRNPEFEQMQQQAEQAMQEALMKRQEGQQGGQNLRKATTITIPVVFHVIYSTDAENLSDEQLLSQLSILNADFRRKNADAANTPSYFQPFAADTEIEFCLASLDPNGDPTSGVTRTKTNKVSFNYLNDEMKFSSQGGVDAWDRNQYLNIWVCRISDNVLGYASLPGSPASTDGVVVHYATVGAPPFNKVSSNYNRGRTATHEVGHWLGLWHIWGNGNSTCSDSDGVDDTPNQYEENTGCPSGNKVSCDNAPYGDMYQNYMDYTDDACMNLFTNGQATRMQAFLSTSRNSLYSSLACSATLRSDFRTEIVGDTLTLAGKKVQFVSASAGIRPTSYFWEFEGGTPATSTEKDPIVTYPNPGRYNVQLTITNGDLNSTKVKDNYVHVTVNDLTVYPNSSTDFITIEQPARITVRQVQMLNHVGQEVLRAEVRDRVLRVDVRNLSPGIYFLHITSTNGTIVKKVSVVR
ncbi:M43 family zinc metalloprotease [Pontibacter sp. MBLB2868]|uniref:M43 family zinc metalloprotease n=1 Tax=Pontibacter sp. MBLB2868 TaxID=3451555 RepID=UPI003F7502D3